MGKTFKYFESKVVFQVNTPQLFLFPLPLFVGNGKRKYQSALTVSLNRKGVIDVDTVKGCSHGLNGNRTEGCYEECYAKKIADRNGINFSVSVKRELVDQWSHRDILIRQLLDLPQTWYRIGVSGDPSYDWRHTINIINALRHAEKTAVIVTKHWVKLSDENISRLRDLDVVVNTSTSGLDTDAELKYRVGQIERLRQFGIRSVNRVVTCDYGDTEWGHSCAKKQAYLLTIKPLIDNPLRVSSNNQRLISGDLRATRRQDSVGGGKLVSLHDATVYLGHCSMCPDQCGVSMFAQEQKTNIEGLIMTQASLFTDENRSRFEH
jgi:hypothetical protein